MMQQENLLVVIIFQIATFSFDISWRAHSRNEKSILLMVWKALFVWYLTKKVLVQGLILYDKSG